MTLLNAIEIFMYLGIAGILIVFVIACTIYECIVYNNIRKACNIYINKNKFNKQPEEVILDESTINYRISQ